MKNKTGFTLAEVLITLVIIGVIAAVTVPILIQKHRVHEFETRFKKAVSIVESVVNIVKFETGEELKVGIFNAVTFKNLLMKQMQVIEDCGMNQCVLKAKPVYRNYANNADATISIFSEGNFVLNNGMAIYIDNDNADLQISIDINGYNKKPNRWGYDVFTFSFIEGNKFMPAGHPDTKWYNYCDKSSTNGYNGIGCTYRAMKNSNYFKEILGG